eukprot:jgi/Ulvmu1/828/UM010_0202.1
MFVQGAARSPSGKQAREREAMFFGVRMPGPAQNNINASGSNCDQDARLAEFFHDRLELGATSLEESKAERLSQKMARLAAEVLSETELEDLTRSFATLGQSAAGSRPAKPSAAATPNIPAHANRRSMPSFPTPPSTGNMDWSPAADGDSAHEGGRDAAGTFKFGAASGSNAPDARTNSQTEPSHKRPSPGKRSGRRHRPRAQFVGSPEAEKPLPPAQAAKPPAPPVDANLFTQGTSAGQTSKSPLKPSRTTTSRSADVIREALAGAPARNSTGTGAAGMSAAPSKPAAAATQASVSSGPTAPFPKMFTGGLGGLSATDCTHPKKPEQSATASEPASQRPSAGVPFLRPFAAATAAGAAGPATSANAEPAKPAAATTANPRNPAPTGAPDKPTKPLDPAAAFRASIFGRLPGAQAAAAPSGQASSSDAPGIQAQPSKSGPRGDTAAGAPAGPSTSADTAAGVAGGTGTSFHSPTAKPAKPAHNPFGSPLTPLQRTGVPPAAAGDGAAEPRNPFAAAAAPPVEVKTPVFQAARDVPAVPGATPPSTDGPSTAGSPFGGPGDAQDWFGMPAMSGSGHRRRGGRVFRRHRENIHAAGEAAPAAAASREFRSSAPAAAQPPTWFPAAAAAPQPRPQPRGDPDSDSEHDGHSSNSERSSGGCARMAPGAGDSSGGAAAVAPAPAEVHRTPAPAGGLWGQPVPHLSPMSTEVPPGVPQPAEAPTAVHSPPRPRFTARRTPRHSPGARPAQPWGHKAKENDVPPNVQPAGADPAAATAASATTAALGAADELRRKGNMLFKETKWPQAEDMYTRSVKALQAAGAAAPPEQIALLLGNRAAARMMQSRVREGLADCMQALKVQPWFTRAVERAAKCYLRLGEFSAADSLLSAALSRPQVGSADAHALAQRLAEVRQFCSDLDGAWAAVAAAADDDAAEAVLCNARALLERAADAFDAKLLHAAALLRTGRWRQAEAAAISAGRAAAGGDAARARQQAWWVQCETLYAEGQLEKCVERLDGGLRDLEKLERVGGAGDGGEAGVERGLEGGSLGHRVPLPAVAHVKERLADLRQVLQGRSAGNKAFEEKRYEEAARLYTLALGERRVAAPAFWARLHSNRAAAYQAQEKWVDALADCGRARALDPTFSKVLARLATLHEAVRRPAAALDFLQQLQSADGGAVARSTLRRRIADLRISEARGATPHHFRMLHLPLTAKGSEVKAAYRRLALVYHPDKARTGCVFAASLSGPPLTVRDAGLRDRVVAAADDLFKSVNEAFTTLSDDTKRDKCAMQLGGSSSAGFDPWGCTSGTDDDAFDFDLRPRRPTGFGRRKPGHTDFW